MDAFGHDSHRQDGLGRVGVDLPANFSLVSNDPTVIPDGYGDGSSADDRVNEHLDVAVHLGPFWVGGFSFIRWVVKYAKG